MSRNLGQVNCAVCGCEVTATGKPYRRDDDDARSNGLLVCDAECTVCRTRYTGWLEYTPGSRWRTPDTGFFDLSYRSTFNDEPGPDDIPFKGRVETFQIVVIDGREVHREPVS